MSIKLQLPALTELKPRIVVVGVGGAGGNAINNMIASGLTGVEFVAANTDAQALSQSAAEHRIQLGVNLTEGLGAGARPEIGEAAAEEAVDDLRQQLSGAHMCFIAAGMGGGTGSGAAAVIARVAKEIGLLTVGVVTKPFQFEGGRRMRIAETGIEALRRHVDTLIVIPNQNLFRVANERTTFADAFKLADQILHSGVACIVDLIVRDGLINLDFADVRTVMSEMGTAMMGTGEAGGERRAIEAAEAAIHNPILDEVSLRGAKGLLLSITGGRDLTLYEVDEAASRIREEVDPDANIIVGATFDDSLENKIRVSIVATGVEIAASAKRPAPVREPSPAPASKAAGSEANEQVKRQLSDAMRQDQRRSQTGPGDEPLDLQGSQRLPDPSGWQGPGSVMITEGMPRLSHGPDQAAGRDGGGQRPPGADNARYQPERPQDPRAAGRRVPEIQEFPPIGQQAYSAGQDTGRKPGFFGRWTAGLQRLAGESVNGDSRGQGASRGAENPGPEGESGRPSAASDIHAQDARRPVEQPVGESGPRSEADGQPTEIPKFFQRKSG